MNQRICINFPTNIGDTVIGLPVLDQMHANYPSSTITVIASRHTEEFLTRNTFVNEVILFDKAWPVSEKIKFSFSLRGKYDIFVDLKNSFLPAIAATGKRTPFYRGNPKNVRAKDMYLQVIKRLAPQPATERSDFYLSLEEQKHWGNLSLASSIFIACSSRSSQKNYPYDFLETVVENLRKKYRVAIVGEESNRAYYKDILTLKGVIDLVGKTKLYDIAYLLRRFAQLLLCVDSSILQLGSYYNIPIVALFGPTDQQRYGPWSDSSIVLRDEHLTCSPCESATCYMNNECMEMAPSTVIDAVEKMILKKKNE
jgi:heptosyltransferase-2